MTLWYPHSFGPTNNASDLSNQVLMQMVEPTRTGLNGIVTKGAVWMSAFNKQIPKQKEDYMYIKPWTEEELAEYNENLKRK